MGRSGVALAMRHDARGRFGSSRQVESRVIIDPKSARILATETYDITGGKVGDEPSGTTLLDASGWTDQLGATARG
jgi:hypothetical protein